MSIGYCWQQNHIWRDFFICTIFLKMFSADVHCAPVFFLFSCDSICHSYRWIPSLLLNSFFWIVEHTRAFMMTGPFDSLECLALLMILSKQFLTVKPQQQVYWKNRSGVCRQNEMKITFLFNENVFLFVEFVLCVLGIVFDLFAVMFKYTLDEISITVCLQYVTPSCWAHKHLLGSKFKVYWVEIPHVATFVPRTEVGKTN